MAQYTRIEVAQAMKETGLVLLFFLKDIELSKKVLKACYEGGGKTDGVYRHRRFCP